MCYLNRKQINIIYNLLESYYFNNHNIGLAFEGYNDGSNVCIYYLGSGKYRTMFDVNDAKHLSFHNVYGKLLKQCLTLIANSVEPLKYQLIWKVRVW